MYNFKIDNQNVEMADTLKPYQYEFECNYSVHDSEFLNSMNYLLGPQLLPGTKLQLLNRQEGWDQTLKLITNAKRSICIESSSSWNNPDGEAFGKLLASKAGGGVPVHFIQAGQAGIFSTQMHIQLTMADVELFTWNGDGSGFADKTSSTTFTSITVDGHTSLLISPDRQVIVQLEGPVCGQIQGAFNEKWIEVQEQVTHGEFYFAPEVSATTKPATQNSDLTQYVDFSNSKTLHRFYLNLVYGIGIAHETLTISQGLIDHLPAPLPPLTRELEKAKQRQVKVQVVPSKYAFLIADQTWTSWIVKDYAVLNVYSKDLKINTLLR